MSGTTTNEMPGIFERIPENLFRPLAAPNRRHYWSLLSRLYDQFFSPDAPPPPEEGYLARSVTAAIEQFVLDTQNWEADEIAPADLPPSGQASAILRMLIQVGWLHEERIGVRIFVVMKPTVQKFLELLKQFAEEGPQLIGGKVQLIFNQLRAVQNNPAQEAAGFHEAAKEARRLIATLNSTALRVREVMELLATYQEPSKFIEAFFRDYIEQIYIRDYHELRTENHPLKHRWDILDIVYRLRDEPTFRTALVEWYQRAFTTVDIHTAEALYEKDVERFLLFARIEDYLDRLDNSVNRTTKRATAYIYYRLRTRDRFDRLLEQTFVAFKEADSLGIPLELPFAPGMLFSEERLRDPRVLQSPTPRARIRNPTMTREQRAMMILRRLIMRNRYVSTKELLEYIQNHVPHGTTRDSSEMSITSINELCAYATLVRLTMLSHAMPHRLHAKDSRLRPLRGIELQIVEGERTDNEFVNSPRFRVRRL